MKIRALLVAVALTATLTACGGSDDKGSDLPSLSPTPSPTKSTTGTLLDNVPTSAPERPKDVRSKAGAFAFSSYVAEVTFYVLATNDIDALYGIADRELCRTCKNVQTAIADRGDKVQVGATPAEVLSAKLLSQEGGYYTVRQRVEVPDGATINSKTGKELSTLKGRVQQMNVNIHWRNGGWILLDYKYMEDKAA